MYKIYDAEGRLLGFSDEARYVRIADNGCYISCKKEDAAGIVFQGKAYEGGGAVYVPGGLSLEEVRATVGLDEDATTELADMVSSHEKAIAELAEMIANSQS